MPIISLLSTISLDPQVITALTVAIGGVGAGWWASVLRVDSHVSKKTAESEARCQKQIQENEQRHKAEIDELNKEVTELRTLINNCRGAGQHFINIISIAREMPKEIVDQIVEEAKAGMEKLQ